jgi:hypothetical protein
MYTAMNLVRIFFEMMQQNENVLTKTISVTATKIFETVVAAI